MRTTQESHVKVCPAHHDNDYSGPFKGLSNIPNGFQNPNITNKIRDRITILQCFSNLIFKPKLRILASYEAKIAMSRSCRFLLFLPHN